MNELPGVLWAYRMTARRPTNISPFALTYGMEAIVPIEIGMPTLRIDIPKQSNVETVIKDLDMANKPREATAVRIASYHSRLENLYNRRVKPRIFQPGDLVLRKVFENTSNPLAGKFPQNWKGPYIVTRADEFKLYALNKLDGTPIPKMWNVMHLKRYYQ